MPVDPTPEPSVDTDLVTTELFGSYVFNRTEMETRLPKAVYKSLMQTISTGAKLDISVADVVAEAMKAWAMEHGATHYAHVFYPLTARPQRSTTASWTPTARVAWSPSLPVRP